MEFSVHICEYNRSNADYETIYRPEGSGDYLFLLFKTPMKVYDRTAFFIAQENACLFYTPDHEQHYQAVQKFRNMEFRRILFFIRRTRKQLMS